MRNAVITGIFLASCLLFLLLLRSLFIPALILSSAALGYVIWRGIQLARQKDLQRVFEVRRLATFLASLLFLTLVVAAWITIEGGLGHGGRAAMTVPLKQLAALLGVLVSGCVSRTDTKRLVGGGVADEAGEGTSAAHPLAAGERWTNSLGMVFAPVPGTKTPGTVLMCVWETRVRDYRKYARANAGVNAEWENPVYEGQSVTSPVSYAQATL